AAPRRSPPAARRRSLVVLQLLLVIIVPVFIRAVDATEFELSVLVGCPVLRLDAEERLEQRVPGVKLRVAAGGAEAAGRGRVFAHSLRGGFVERGHEPGDRGVSVPALAA